MARKRKSSKPAAFVMFNVVYHDGTLSSNRRVPGEALQDLLGTDEKDLALNFITGQDLSIAERSGQAKAKIKTVSRVKAA
jgi:hypothetical protein